LNGIVVEADVLGQLLVVEVRGTAKISAPSGAEQIKVCD